MRRVCPSGCRGTGPSASSRHADRDQRDRIPRTAPGRCAIRAQILTVRGRTMRIGDRACPWNGPGIAGCELRIGGRRSCCPRENGEVALRRRGVVARSRICDASCLDDFAGCRNHLLLAPRRRRVRTRQRSAAQPRAKRVRPRRLTDYWQGCADVPESKPYRKMISPVGRTCSVTFSLALTPLLTVVAESVDAYA